MSMEMDHSFTVPVPPERAWDVLLDVERIAPCMPGATVDEFDGEVVTGRIKVKVGPVSLTYRGTAKFTERDDAAQVVVVEAGGKLVEKFAENLAQQISGNGAAAPEQAGAATAGAATAGASAAGASAAGASAAGASAAGASAAADGGTDGAGAGQATATAEGGSGSAEPTVTVPVTSTASAPSFNPAPQNEDSINLVRLVGPAILKRVVPVALVAAALTLLARRFRHLFRRTKA